MANAYATVEEFESRYGDFETVSVSQVGDSGRADSPNRVRIVRAIEGATAEIDSILAVEYDVPLNPIPAAIVDICLALARDRLDSFSAREDAVTEAATARDRLREFAEGRRLLPNPQSLSTFGQLPSLSAIASRGFHFGGWDSRGVGAGLGEEP